MASLVVLSAVSRLTVFPLEEFRVAYTSRSSDERGLGDIAILGVIQPEGASGDMLWRLAASMYTNPPSRQVQARWLLTQSTRARMCRAACHEDLPGAAWTGEFDRVVVLDSTFANHDALRTGRITVE
ncbi:hypothetical protein [Streptomyces sp. NBC_01794]|uniref:hypothetical protein n=1 Tax=Streptomyces sp. NBC_01794 TaxID=2975942 RepID=UPI003090558B|nr:hypothetical protein OIE54_10900 [Streptomyces sp. NBC_01794]